MPDQSSLRDDAIRIWRAGVEAVRPERLFEESLRVETDRLLVVDSVGDEHTIDLDPSGRILVVGGGKAGAGMALGLERALGDAFLGSGGVEGLLSVPEDCVAPTQKIRLVAGRPAGVNEPRKAGAVATAEMLRLVSQAQEKDLVICLLSGGGSALLPAPTPPLTLDQKASLTRLLSASGATINELNVVRQQLSEVKGGGLARACRADRLLTLAISDVLGDPRDLIASGPTVEASSTPEHAIEVLQRLGVQDDVAAKPIVDFLRAAPSAPRRPATAELDYVMLANNAMAVDAAGVEAERLGYNHAMTSASDSEGEAEEVGRHLAGIAIRMRGASEKSGPNCLISGGEPTVRLAPEAERGLGGRNQQLVLAALQELGDCQGVALLSGGTDGEDGPTDAAGAVVDQEVVRHAEGKGLSAEDHLRRNDAYHYFAACDALVSTGPTGTNVCDLRVVVTPKKA